MPAVQTTHAAAHGAAVAATHAAAHEAAIPAAHTAPDEPSVTTTVVATHLAAPPFIGSHHYNLCRQTGQVRVW